MKLFHLREFRELKIILDQIVNDVVKSTLNVPMINLIWLFVAVFADEFNETDVRSGRYEDENQEPPETWETIRTLKTHVLKFNCIHLSFWKPFLHNSWWICIQAI